MKRITMQLGLMRVNCSVLIGDDRKAVLVDPGANPNRILSFLEEQKLKLKAILLTHGHFDHITAVPEILKQIPVPVYLHGDDAEMTLDSVKNGGVSVRRPTEPFTPDVFVEDGDELELAGMKFTVIHTPGHTKGSVCYRVGEFLLAGDTLFAGSVGRTDLYGGDMNALFDSLKKLDAIDEDLIVIPGHGEETTLNAEKRTNPYMGVLR